MLYCVDYLNMRVTPWSANKNKSIPGKRIHESVDFRTLFSKLGYYSIICSHDNMLEHAVVVLIIFIIRFLTAARFRPVLTKLLPQISTRPLPQARSHLISLVISSRMAFDVVCSWNDINSQRLSMDFVGNSVKGDYSRETRPL